MKIKLYILIEAIGSWESDINGKDILIPKTLEKRLECEYFVIK